MVLKEKIIPNRVIATPGELRRELLTLWCTIMHKSCSSVVFFASLHQFINGVERERERERERVVCI